MLTLIVAAVAAALAVGTTRRVARYGASGMTAGMAAMMAAMGSGLAVGYAAGTGWDLATATLGGVLAGGAHGLWMGRRYGPMAALDGAGGGVMGGLMGPMLAIMLLYAPLGLVATASLMLGLQLAFSAGAVYLVAAAGGAASASGALGLVGRVLGAESETAATGRDLYGVLAVTADASATEVAQAFLEVSRKHAGDAARLAIAREALAVLSDPVRRARYEAARQEDAACCPPKVRARVRAARARRRSLLPAALAVVGVVLTVAVIGGAYVPALDPTGDGAQAFGESGVPSGTTVQAVVAPLGPDGAQHVDMQLADGRYTPRLVQVKSGTPVRLAIEAIGDPG